MQAVHIMLGPLKPVTGEHAFALAMDLQHVLLCLGALPAKNGHEHVRHVIHQVHGVIPANDNIARLEGFLGVRLRRLLFVGQHFRDGDLGHEESITAEGTIFKHAHAGQTRVARYARREMAENDDKTPDSDGDSFGEFEAFDGEEKFVFVPSCVEVPPVFHSFLEEGPFTKCTVCEAPLSEDGTQYLIHKAFHREEVIFEYAICLPCRARMQEELSAESIERINAYMDQYNMEARSEEMMANRGPDVSAWLSKCLITGRPVAEADEHHIYAFCDGPDLVFSGLPLAVIGDVNEKLNELLSQKTRDRLDGFVDEQFGLPPELKQPIKDSPVLV